MKVGKGRQNTRRLLQTDKAAFEYFSVAYFDAAYGPR